MTDTEMLEKVAIEVREFMERKFTPMTAEITRLRDSLEQQSEYYKRQIEELKESIDLDEIADTVLRMIPVPERGKDGKDGEKGDKGEDAKVDADLIAAKVLALIPPSRDGRDGEKGAKGDPGLNGKGIARIAHDRINHTLDIVIDGGEVFTLSLPEPERGERGEKGDRGVKGEPGIDGMDGKDGLDGSDGKDGFSLDDFDVNLKGRTLELTLKASDGLVISRELQLDGMVLDRDLYRPGQSYDKGDAVTYGGSYWIARRETKSIPKGSDDWRLAVKHGRDGKDAPQDDEE